ncbi:hypothetical protein ABIB82_007755 [Bradyrhizobium sp. i1.8.4]|uniref:hypothetical protein n=1 Tax=unclassified Bradyrhizobium TaxID=2631580 RepID=UPI003D247AEB
MTNLRSALDKYLSMRKGLGYKYQHQTRQLADFVAFMEKRKARIITTKLAREWATLPPDRHASWALRLSDVRGFAPCRQLRSENGGAARMEARQALCLQRRGDRCVADGSAGSAASGRATPMDLPYLVRADRGDGRAYIYH